MGKTSSMAMLAFHWQQGQLNLEGNYRPQTFQTCLFVHMGVPLWGVP